LGAICNSTSAHEIEAKIDSSLISLYSFAKDYNDILIKSPMEPGEIKKIKLPQKGLLTTIYGKKLDFNKIGVIVYLNKSIKIK